MTKKKAEQIAKHWNENFAGVTEVTKTTANAVKTSPKKDGYEVEIIPAGENDGLAFFHSEELVDVKRVFGVSCIVSYNQFKGHVYGRLF